MAGSGPAGLPQAVPIFVSSANQVNPPAPSVYEYAHRVTRFEDASSAIPAASLQFACNLSPEVHVPFRPRGQIISQAGSRSRFWL